MMKVGSFLSVLFGSCLCAMASVSMADTSPRIIGGHAATVGEHEYFASLLIAYNWDSGETSLTPQQSSRYSWNSFCGGSYIGNKTVITAAHCIKDLPSSGTLHLLVGNYSNTGMQWEFCADEGAAVYSCQGRNTANEELTGFHPTGWTMFTGSEAEIIEVSMSDIVIHQQYSTNTLINDIAIIPLPQLINNPALTLPTSDLFKTLASSTDTGNVQVIGHGDTISDNDSKTFQASAQLLEVDITARTNTECRAFFGSQFIEGYMICAGDSGLDSCQGDSGGPLIEPDSDTLLGVVSWGPDVCGASGTSYGVYTNVFTHVEWIESGGLAGFSGGMVSVNENGDTIRMGNSAAGSLGMGVLLVSGLLLWRRRSL